MVLPHKDQRSENEEVDLLTYVLEGRIWNTVGVIITAKVEWSCISGLKWRWKNVLEWFKNLIVEVGVGLQGKDMAVAGAGGSNRSSCRRAW